MFPPGAIDADALKVLQELPTESALKIVSDLEFKGSKLNNPSAFVTARARQLVSASDRTGGQRTPSGEDVQGAYSEIVESLGLDEKARSLLREVPIEEATNMLQTLVEQRSVIGNISAFITREVRNFQHARARQAPVFDGPSKPMPRPGGMPPEIADMIERSDLDTRAKEALAELPDDEVMHILRELREKDNIRNPSAFVFRAVTNRQSRLPARGDPRDMWAGGERRPPPGFEDGYRDDRPLPPMSSRDWPPYNDRFPPPTAPGGGSRISDRLLGLCEDAGLNRAATERLRTLSPDGALDVIQSLMGRRGEVLDNSDWVINAVDRYNDGVHPDSLPSVFRPVGPTGKGGFPPPMRGRELAERLEELLQQAPPSLDSRARAALQDLHPAEAVDILEDVLNKQDEIRNLSAFVFRAVTTRTAGKGGGFGPGPGAGIQAPPPRRHVDQEAPPPPPAPPPPGHSAWNPATATPDHRRRRQELDMMAEDAGLDARARDALDEVAPEDAMDILHESRSKGDLRNPSAWVCWRISILRQSGGRGPPGPARHGSSPHMPPPAPGARASPPRMESPFKRRTPAPPPKEERAEECNAEAEGGGAEDEPPPVVEPPANELVGDKTVVFLDWLSEIDSNSGQLSMYASTLEKNYDSVEQVLLLCVQRDEVDGSARIDTTFLNELGVKDPEHRRLFEQWALKNL